LYKKKSSNNLKICLNLEVLGSRLGNEKLEKSKEIYNSMRSDGMLILI